MTQPLPVIAQPAPPKIVQPPPAPKIVNLARPSLPLSRTLP